MYPRNSKVIPEDSKSIEHYTTSEMDPNRDNDFHVRRGIICVHEPAPSFPKTPSPTSESTPKDGKEKRQKRQRRQNHHSILVQLPSLLLPIRIMSVTSKRPPRDTSKNEPELKLKPKSPLPQDLLTKSAVLRSQRKNLVIHAAANYNRQNETRGGRARRRRHAEGFCVADLDAQLADDRQVELCLGGTVLCHLQGVEGGCFGGGELLAESGDGDVGVVEGRLVGGGGGGGVHGGAGREGGGSLCAVASLVVGFSVLSGVWLVGMLMLAGRCECKMVMGACECVCYDDRRR